MKIKSTVLQVLAAASLGAGLLYAMGIEGRGPTGRHDHRQRVHHRAGAGAAGCLFMRLGFAAQDAEEKTSRKVHKQARNTVKSKRKVG